MRKISKRKFSIRHGQMCSGKYIWACLISYAILGTTAIILYAPTTPAFELMDLLN